MDWVSPVCKRKNIWCSPFPHSPFVLGLFLSLFSTLLSCPWFLRSDEAWWSTGPCDSLTSACILSPIWVCDHTYAPCSSLLYFNPVHEKNVPCFCSWVNKKNIDDLILSPNWWCNNEPVLSDPSLESQTSEHWIKKNGRGSYSSEASKVSLSCTEKPKSQRPTKKEREQEREWIVILACPNSTTCFSLK